MVAVGVVAVVAVAAGRLRSGRLWLVTVGCGRLRSVAVGVGWLQLVAVATGRDPTVKICLIIIR